MAIIDARILRSVKITESKGDKGSIQLSATEDYLIICDAKNPNFSDIMQDTTVWDNLGNKKLPQINDEITITGVELYCTSRDLSYYQDNERSVVMSVRYDAKDDEAGGEGDPTGGDQDAWKRIQIQSADVSLPARGWRGLANSKDAGAGSEKPAINSAGDPVDGLEEEASMLRFTYTNTITVNPAFDMLLYYTNKCNFGPLNILGIGCSTYTVRCTGFNASYDQKNNVWSVTVELLYNPNGWEIRFYDAGFNEVVAGERLAILDKRGNPVSSPVALDGNGRAVAPDVITDSEAGGPAMRVLYPYISTDLSNLFRDANI
jgi:hypothetical protein